MSESAEKLWNSASELLSQMVNPETFNLWFSPIEPLRFEDQEATLCLGVANEFCGVWLKDNYDGVLSEVLSQVAGREIRVSYESTPSNGTLARPQAVQEAELDEEQEKVKAAKGSAKGKGVVNGTMPRRDMAVEVELNPKNNFDSFVVGANNNFAYAAARAVAQAPGKSYNPLFLYGGVGLGKTHLLHAIGHESLRLRPDSRIAYVSSEKFTNEYIAAIQSNQLVKFRKKYRQTDVLLIDDIQFLAGKERIQEEFFHTFNALREVHKQIVLTCDRPANEIKNLEQRLISRFEWGLVTDLQPPEIEVRVAILRNKEKSLGVELPNEIIEFLAEKIRTNVRRLEGALIRVASYASLTGKEVTIQVLENLLKEVIHEEVRSPINIETIQKKVAEHFDIRLADMTSKRRPENIAFPRQIAMFLARQLTKNSLNTIGEAFGGRDHGTVMHACRLVKDRMEVDPQIKQTVLSLEQQLQR